MDNKRSFWDKNGLFVELLIFFLCIWVFIYSAIPVGHAEEIYPDDNAYLLEGRVEVTFNDTDDYAVLYVNSGIGVVTPQLLNHNRSFRITIRVPDTATSSPTISISGVNGYITVPVGETVTLTSSFYVGSESTEPITIRVVGGNPATLIFRAHGSVQAVEVDNSAEEEAKTKHWYDYIIGGITDFFEVLFSPIVNLVNSIADFIETQQAFMDSIDISGFSDFWDYLSDVSTQPILDFFDSINTDAIKVVKSVWEFPLIKDIILAVVAILCFAGVMALLMTI